MRIVSFLPAGSEIVHALGAGSELVGRSHECDFPAAVTRLPVVSRPALRLEGLAAEEIDRAVAGRLLSGESLYEVDEVLLDQLQPEVILTQDLCQVCAPSGNELSRSLQQLNSKPRVVWLSPQSLADIERNILAVGDAIGRRAEAEALVAGNQKRIIRVGEAVAGAEPRRVVFLEWVEPVFSAGHWVPEMIGLAGGLDPLGQAGADSVRVRWEAVVAAAPEMVIVAPCGYRLEGALKAGRGLAPLPGARIYAVDANAYFARPGPRVVEGIELLAHLFHPERFAWPHGGRPWAELGSR
ncbi:MAG TPA: ABC transporter substrate-binding protein [Gemmatimonadales bacterium]|jgi:iron complex transport system substrate-binding protein|nr:ABC transporter substrate-binding protein [Gemmatimonadales bacterium]